MALSRKQTPEQFVGLLRQIGLGTANGKAAAIACADHLMNIACRVVGQSNRHLNGGELVSPRQ